MLIATTTTVDDLTIAVCGEVDLGTVEQLRATLADAVETVGVQVVVDLAQVTYMDSVGLGVLVGANKRLRATGRRLVVRSVQPRVRKLFRLTGLDQLLEVVEPVQQAAASF